MAEIFMAAAATAMKRRTAHPKETASDPLKMNIEQASASIRTGDIDNPDVYNHICINLASTIESATVKNAVPSSTYLLQLPLIVKEVYRRKTEFLQPSLMLLMLPIKAACQIGWFPDEDRHHLLTMAKKVMHSYSNTEKMNIEPSYAHSHVANIIARFYPRMQVEHILTSFDVKAGYGIFLADFHISLGTLSHQIQDLWLLVARMDNMDTADCIITPSNVDFVINRVKVPKRTKCDMDKGPQLPSNLTKLARYGVNLLQVFGDFDGQYIIAVAFMSLISSPELPHLKDYVHSLSGEVDSDGDVIKIPSRISLNCPISERRIKTPVKGHRCKHPQCFDYSYFVEMNSMMPTWKCPVCNKPVCNLDLRIDQGFLKTLNEAAKNVRDVILSTNGSWMVAVTEKSQSTETSRNATSQNSCVPDTPGNLTSAEANDALPNSSDLHNSGGSAISARAKHPSTSWRLTVTTPAVSPQGSMDSHLQSQDSHEMIHKPPSVHQTRHHLDPVNLTTTQPSYSSTSASNPSAQSQPQQGQTDRATQPLVGTTTTKKAQNTNSFTTVQLTPCKTTSLHSTALSSEHLSRGSERRHTFPGQSQVSAPTSGTLGKHVQQQYASPGESHPAPATPTAAVRAPFPASAPTLSPSGDALPSGRMRGSLTGKEREAARVQFLAPPPQPISANKPWSLPTPTLPMGLLLQQPPDDSKNVSNSGDLPR